MLIIVIVSCLIIFAVSIFLALCQEYEDGIVGNIALGGMAVSTAGPLYEMANGSEYEFAPTTVLLYAAVAAFMARHLYRFIKWRKTGENDWSKSDGD
jgi:hypothetical protein